MLKPLTMWITVNSGKFLKRWEYQITLPASCKTCVQVKKQQLEPDMEQQTGSKLGKEDIKFLYCHPAYLTSMQSTSCEMPSRMKHKLESRLPGGMSITSDMAESKEELKSLLMSERAGLKLNIQKAKIMASGPITLWQIDEETVIDLISWAPKLLQMVTAAMKLKNVCSLEEKLWPT